jgi:hypothetical protein
MRKILYMLPMLILAGCAKDNKVFTLKMIRLNEYRKINLPVQKLYLEVFEDNDTIPMAHTAVYPSDLTLPASFKVEPSIPITLYSKDYYIQLSGEVTGYIARCKVNMDEYKIIFPIDMEVENDSLNISIIGSWK